MLVYIPLFCDIPTNPNATSIFTTNPITLLPVLTELKFGGEFLLTPTLVPKVPPACQWLVGEVGTK